LVSAARTSAFSWLRRTVITLVRTGLFGSTTITPFDNCPVRSNFSMCGGSSGPFGEPNDPSELKE
jgi:hypothetical protein